jgi:hypothetical protein
MDIGNVLSRAWQTIWKHKVFWIFGILAGCGSASTSGGSNTGWRFASEEFNGYYLNIEGWQLAGILTALFCLGLIIIFLVIFLGTIGRIGLVRGTQLVDGGREKLNFGELFNESMPYFWRVFGLSLLIFLLVFFIGIPLSIITCGIGALALIIVLPALVELSVVAIVVEDLGVFDGLKRGWDVYKDNLGTMILLWLILYLGLGLITAFIVGIPLALLAVPIMSGLIIGTDSSSWAGFIISAICFVAFIPVLLAISGILRAFVTSSWTLTYLELTGQSSTPAPALPPKAPQPPEEPETPKPSEPPEEPDEPLPDPL